MPKEYTVQSLIDEDLFNWLKQRAEDDDRTMSGFIRKILLQEKEKENQIEEVRT